MSVESESGGSAPSAGNPSLPIPENRMQAVALGVLAIVAMLTPLLLRALVDAFGVRTVASVLALLGAAGAATTREASQRRVRAAGAVPAAIATVTGTMTPLLFVPAILYAALAYLFFTSLREPRSIVERLAKAIEPSAPDFIAPYCRRATALWGSVFAVNAAILAIAPAFVSHHTWESLASYGVWSWMAVVALVEFLVRKTYFRNYWYRGPFERFWSKRFPAEATPMGRRSAAHIRETRRRLGLDE